MHNDRQFIGLNHRGEPSPTLRTMDMMLREATGDALGVHDVRRRGDVLEVDTVLVPQSPGDETHPKTFRFSVPATFIAWGPELRSAYVVGVLYVHHQHGPSRGTPEPSGTRAS